MSPRKPRRAMRLPTPSEKDVERLGDKIMAMLGFTAWRYSQARATQQSPGIPDRFYTHPTRGLHVFWEAKRPGGKQRPAQRVFQTAVTLCGLQYVCGTDDALIAWCEGQGLCRVQGCGAIEILNPVTESEGLAS